MCIRDSVTKNAEGITPELLHSLGVFVPDPERRKLADLTKAAAAKRVVCLLYTSDAADERSSVDLGGRRIIKKKTLTTSQWNKSQPEHTLQNVNQR